MENAMEPATEAIKSHSLVPLCDWGQGIGLNLAEMIAVVILGLLLSLAWVAVNERGKRRSRRRTPALGL